MRAGNHWMISILIYLSSWIQNIIQQ